MAKVIKSVAKQITPDEKQELKDFPKVSTAWKGHFSRSAINEYQLPGKDGTSTLLRIWGPAEGGARLKMDDVGTINFICGRHDGEYGDGSGRLNMSSYGGMWKNEGSLHIVCNKDDSGTQDKAKKKKNGEAVTDKDGLNILVESGNYTEETKGGQRSIEARSIYIKATDELVLEGGSGIRLITAGDIVTGSTDSQEIASNKMNIIFGQDMTLGAKEKTDIAYDPRSTQSVVTPGHLNHMVLGDYKLRIAGNYQQWVAGLKSSTKLIKKPPASMDIRAFLDDLKIQAAQGIEMISRQDGMYFEATKGDVDILAKDGKMTLESKDDMSLESKDKDLSLTAKVKAILTGGDIDIDATSGDVKITTGGVIKLN